MRAFSGAICPKCLEIATTNGAKFRAWLETRFAREQGLHGALAAHDRLVNRVDNTLREFGLTVVAPPLPAWAERLADKTQPLPPGAAHSKMKLAAISDLRLEAASVRVALDRLGYLGTPVEDKLSKTVADGSTAAAALAAWDGLAADSVQEHELREAAETLAASDQTTGTLLDSVKRRDLSPLVEAVIRRDRAVTACGRSLGVA